jgi:ribosomal protein S18 acetylase RimI-like enzyme
MHRRLQANPGYDAELNPVAVAPDGELAASCMCWLDERNRSGEIEPLGTRHAHRRLGLARAIVLEAARRLRERGAEHVLVYGVSVNEPARRLYASAGFRAERTLHAYVHVRA